MEYYAIGKFAERIGVIQQFSGKLQGKRVNKAKKMIKELLEDDTKSES